MIEQNNEPSTNEKDSAVEQTASTGVMFVTILLLIGGLLLTSVMLVHYGMRSTDENGESVSGLTRLVEIVKSSVAERQSEPDAAPAATPPQTVADTPAAVSPPSAATSTPTNTQEKTSIKSKLNDIKDLFSRNRDGSIRWPRLRLAGFGRPAEGEMAFAIINGKHVVEGSLINDVKVVEIREQGVVVEYKGERKTLIVEMGD